MASPKTKSANKKTPAAITPLEKWLKDRNHSQIWLADRLGVSLGAMSRIVRGINMPRAQLALDIHQLTGVTVEQLARARARRSPATRQDMRAARIRHAQSLVARGQALLAEATAGK